MRALSKLGGGKISVTSAALESLKQQHAEELATVNEEHARQLVALENEVERCRAEIDALRALSDEHCDTLMPLPPPLTSLKFVKNTTGRRGKKLAANASNSAVSTIADVKQQHKKDLAKAAEIYARKLHALKKELNKYKKETDAQGTSATGDCPRNCNNSGVNTMTGVAQNEKENISHKREIKNKSTHSSRLKKEDAIQHKDDINPILPKFSAMIERTRDKSTHGIAGMTKNRGGGNELEDPIDPYERLFLKDYRFDKDEKCEEILRKCAQQRSVKREKNLVLCQDLIAFMKDVRENSILDSPTKGVE